MFQVVEYLHNLEFIFFFAVPVPLHKERTSIKQTRELENTESSVDNLTSKQGQIFTYVI